MSRADAIAHVVALTIKAAIAPIAAELGTLRDQFAAQRAHGSLDVVELDALKQQLQRATTDLDALKAAPFLRAGGVWKPTTAYVVHDTATYDGSLWQCTTAHASADAFDRGCWRLIVKRGRDGRDAGDPRGKP